MKKDALKNVKQHYFIMVATMLLAVLLGTSSLGSLDLFRVDRRAGEQSSSVRVLTELVHGNFSEASDIAQENLISEGGKDVTLGHVAFGRQDGILAEALNMRSSGSFIAAAGSAVLNIVKRPDWASAIIMLVAVLLIGAKTIFISNEYKLVYTRIFLESRKYKKVHFSTYLFLLRTRLWVKSSWANLRCSFTMFLWCLTIVGGPIKVFSYFAARFILAENPAVSGKDALTLSRRMMDGHKMELFKLRLSFIGWDILSLLTGRILEILFLTPYREATYTEYYAYIRSEAKAKGIEGVEVLKDEYLYVHAPMEAVEEAYAEEIAIMNEPDVVITQLSKFRVILQNVFGIVATYGMREEEYRKVTTEKSKIAHYKSVVEGEAYPYKLCPTPVHPGRNHLELLNYMCHYSIPSMVFIFFAFCFGGWLWEVSLHIIEDGVFVNRGVLHGPWLPIYGVGAVIILTFLFRLRQNPLLEFVAAIVLCGVVEYTGSYMLERLHGEKWWDYTGYFLNINGRICAEGLLVFGIAGVAAVYVLAPELDNIFRKLRLRYAWALCILLMSIFIGDLIYSHYYPNMGAGITDYSVPEAYVAEDPSIMRIDEFIKTNYNVRGTYYSKPIKLDITGDGYEDICATVSVGNDVISDSIVVLDSKSKKIYLLDGKLKYSYIIAGVTDDGLLVRRARYNLGLTADSDVVWGTVVLEGSKLVFVSEE